VSSRALLHHEANTSEQSGSSLVLARESTGRWNRTIVAELMKLGGLLKLPG
jgi:hypothetical protein